MRSTIKHLMLFFGQNDHRRPFFAYGPFFISFFVPHFSSHNFGVLFDDVAPIAHHACTFLSLFPPPPLLPSSPLPPLFPPCRLVRYKRKPRRRRPNAKESEEVARQVQSAHHRPTWATTTRPKGSRGFNGTIAEQNGSSSGWKRTLRTVSGSFRTRRKMLGKKTEHSVLRRARNQSTIRELLSMSFLSTLTRLFEWTWTRSHKSFQRRLKIGLRRK